MTDKNIPIENSSQILLSIIFISIFLGVMLLAVATTLGALSDANQDLNGNTTTSGIITNETLENLNNITPQDFGIITGIS